MRTMQHHTLRLVMSSIRPSNSTIHRRPLSTPFAVALVAAGDGVVVGAVVATIITGQNQLKVCDVK